MAMRERLRSLPSVDVLLQDPDCQSAMPRHGRTMVVEALRSTLAELRREAKINSAIDLSREAIFRRLLARLDAADRPSIRPVINLTGTVLHTNLGRASLPEEAVQAAAAAHRSACNIEFELATGIRGERDDHVVPLLRKLTGAEAALAVNNNAAAVMLALASVAAGKKVLISRGELVEIGGSFRMPEIIAAAGCRLCEVGTTNRTHVADYECAIDADTAAILKVHTSNYAIVGFTSAPEERELAALAHRHRLPFIVDLGAGSLIDLTRWGLPREQTPSETLRNGADLVTFSGDKLLGGPQAGLIVGGAEWLVRLRKNPFRRALRLDKGRLAAIEAVLRIYQDADTLPQALPVLRHLLRPADDIRAVAERIHPYFAEALGDRASVDVAPCESIIGSGSQPLARLPSFAVRLSPAPGEAPSARLEAIALLLRQASVPIVGRVHAGALWLDCRVLDNEAQLTNCLREIGA